MASNNSLLDIYEQLRQMLDKEVKVQGLVQAYEECVRELTIRELCPNPRR